MLKRIVKMQFAEGDDDQFLAVFAASAKLIRAVDGCHYLELLRDHNAPGTFFTLSFWRDEEALNAYRKSDLFKNTWDQTKPLFTERAVAWSVQSQFLLA